MSDKNRPCKCERCDKTAPYKDGDCRMCWLWHNNARYRAFWESGGVRADITTAKVPLATLDCPHRGEQVVNDGVPVEISCDSCGGKTRYKVFHCKHPAREPDQITYQDCRSCAYLPKLPAADVKPLILRNWLSPGDVLATTAAIHSLHASHPGKFLTAIDTSANALFEHNPHVISRERAYELKAEIVEMHPEGKKHDNLINHSNQRAVHVLERDCRHLEQVLGVRVPLMTNRPHLYLSSRERSWVNQVEEVTKRKTPFWLVCAGRKGDYTTKFAGTAMYQDVVSRLRGRVLFVQVGAGEHHHPPLKNVLNLVGKTDQRQLVRLAYHAEGGLGGVTFLQHLLAALEKPYVCVMGGREPVHWNSYQRQHLFHTVGMLDCCKSGGCWKSRVVALDDGDKDKNGSLCHRPIIGDETVPQCMTMIRSAEVADKILDVAYACR